jgi:single-stranded DNA-binding protein
MRLTSDDRSLLYVDADARMETYTDKEGNPKTNLSLIASMYIRGQDRRQRGANTRD